MRHHNCDFRVVSCYKRNILETILVIACYPYEFIVLVYNFVHINSIGEFLLTWHWTIVFFVVTGYFGFLQILQLLPDTPDFSTYPGFHGVPRFSPLFKVTHSINEMLLKLALNNHGKSNIIICSHLLFYIYTWWKHRYQI